MNIPLTRDIEGSLVPETRLALVNAILKAKATMARKRHTGPHGLLEFVKDFWHVLEPQTPFVNGWPAAAICEHLEAVTKGEITRLLMNVPPGFCKPNHEDAYVVTGRGRIRLHDVVVGDHILTHRGRYKRVQEVHLQGKLPLIEVITYSGRKNKTAPDHPYLTTLGWVQAKDLKVNDVLAAVCPIDGDHWDRVSAEEARLLGYMVGDGSCTHYPTFTNADPEVLADFVRCAAACGLRTATAKTPPSKPKNYKAAVLRLNGASAWLKKHGLDGKDSYEKFIPPLVLASSARVIANFLGAYWSCDGEIIIRHSGKRGSIYVSNTTTVSEQLAHDLQHALLRVGINARVRPRSRKQITKAQPGGVYRYFHVQTCAHEDTVLFKDMPGLCSRKNAGLNGLSKRRFVQGPLFEDPIASIQDAGMGNCRCLTVEDDHSFTAGDLAVHNSLLTDVFWPAWEWGPMNKPHLRYVTFSYSSSLTERDNRRFGDLVSSTDYQELYGDRVKLRKLGEKMVSNSATGWKLASSVGGVGTGERGDRIILDDPHNVKEAESDIVRQETVRWFRESMSNRLNDAVTGAIIIIMQRVQQEDVSGVILEERMDYVHLMIPMEADPAYQLDDDGEPITTDIGWSDPRYDDDDGDIDEITGTLAWPERFPPSACARLEKDVGPYAWAGQYQQTPTPRGGGIFKTEWWQLWESEDGKFPAFDYLLASLDSAFTEREENDPSGLTIWGVFQKEGLSRIMLVHAWRKHLQFSGVRIDQDSGESKEAWVRRTQKSWGLLEWLKHTCERFKVDKLLIEAKANGISAAQELQNRYVDLDFAIQLCPVKGDKIARAHAAQPTFSKLLVYAPTRDWAEMVIEEMAVFPKGKYKDLTDSATQAIKYLRDNGLASTDQEAHQREIESLIPRRAKSKAIYPV